jgi:hypothetical protein
MMLAVSICCGALSLIGTSLHSRHRIFYDAIGT